MAVRTSRLIFYQVPKTGGEWTKAALAAAGLRPQYCRGSERHPFDLWRDHATPAGTQERYKAGRLGFCVVRHPVAWYKSFWCYRTKSQKFNRRFPPDRYWSGDFNEFVSNVLAAFPNGFVTAMYQYYVDDVDFVGRQEALADSLVEALRLAGETFDEDALRALPPTNVVGSNPRWGDLCQMSATTRALIERVESWVIERFYETAG
jgi:hypothetical protein